MILFVGVFVGLFVYEFINIFVWVFIDLIDRFFFIISFIGGVY